MTLCTRFVILSALSIANVNGAAGRPESCRSYMKDTGAEIFGEIIGGVTRTQTVLDEKISRTPAQKKIDSQLLYSLKQKRGETRGIPTERITFETDQKGRMMVDITARVAPRVTSQIRKLGGVVVSEDQRYHAIRARLALEKLEALAIMKEVSFISPAAQAKNNRGTH